MNVRTLVSDLLRHGERPYKCIARGMAFVKRASLLSRTYAHWRATDSSPIAVGIGSRRSATGRIADKCGYTYDWMLLLRLHVQLGFQSAIQFGSLQVQNNPTDYNK